MELTTDEIIEKCAEQCLRYTRNTLSSYKYERTCVACRYNVLGRKIELTKIQRKRVNFLNKIKISERKIKRIGIDVYRIYESVDFNDFF